MQVAVGCAKTGLARWDGAGVPGAGSDGDPHAELLRSMEPVPAQLHRTRALAVGRTGRYDVALDLLRAVGDAHPRDEEVLAALLRGSRRGTPVRHQTLVAVIDWSWNLLDEAEQAALLQLGDRATGRGTP